MLRTRLSFAAGVLLASAAVAAPLPSGLPSVTITARDEPIAAFLRNLFNQAGRSVITAPSLTGTVNGSFTGPADKVFRDISRAFNLTGYYDGSAVYIYPSTELTSKSFDVGTGGSSRVIKGVAALGVTDAQNFVRPTGAATVVATGTPRFVEQVADVARAGGAPTTGGIASLNQAPAEPRTVPLEFRVFYLRYARAEDTIVYAGNREVRVPGIATIMRGLVVDERGRGAATSYGSRQIRSSAQRVGGTGLGSVAPDDTQSSVLGLPPVGSVAAGGGMGEEGGVVPASTADVVRIEANPYMNAVIIRDAPQRMAAYESLIRAIDVEPQLVEIEATIIDINTTRARELGIDFRFGSGGFGALFGRGDSSDLQLLPNTGISRQQQAQGIAPTARGLAISTVIGAEREFLSRITALETKGAARVVSRPQVMTLSNIEAVFDRTRTFYVRVAGRQNVDLFNVTAGTTLRVNPSVFRDQGQTRIRVLIGIEDGSISSQSVDAIPIVDRASVNTQALILEGESLLLGGLTSDVDSNSEDKIPLLGDIPVVGNLFKKQRRQRDRIERLFLITPRLASLTPRLPTSATPAALAAPLPMPRKP
ncbi:type III secretion system outer membrane ring subunit SctC [Glacieibacterium frigidum]|uniref:Type 3 secretion system secretin n=1 Tax=Glacieibacterium frigidum TaxID=2593303 RepID=A0A552UGL7_9SPHN|nr:type III secretion system outer membrane ring subunit SctC [Glacieibacterium frigidum]TRW17368.1 EscC/YscC/HrcC family type III secretion system outer membrane ring protein [Glacieibacterium frigidum]